MTFSLRDIQNKPLLERHVPYRSNRLYYHHIVGSADTPDVIVKAERDTACTLYTAPNPVRAFETAYNNGEITVEATNPVDSAKVYVVDKVVGVLGL